MIRLLRLLHLPFWRRAPLGFLLPALGVALGVAAIVAVDLAGVSAVESFRDTIRRLDGRTTHRVTGTRVPDGLARRLAEVPGVLAAAPVVERMALVVPPSAGGDQGVALRLFGIDPLAEGGIRSLGIEEEPLAERTGPGAAGEESEERAAPDRPALDLMGRPGALLVARDFLDRYGLSPGDSLSLIVGARRGRAFVLGRLPDEVGDLRVPEDLAVGDIATIQELAHDFDGVDRVDLVIAGAGRAATLARLEAILPAGVRLEEPGREAARLERVLGAFRVNVRALSYLALFVSFFLIYDSLLLSVLSRRPQIAVARCVGATRRQILTGWLGEALVTGAVGTAVGLGLGVVFARPALAEVSRTATDLYGASGPASLAIVPVTLVRAAVIGLAFTLVSALAPALEAAKTAPAHTSARSGVERAARQRRRLAPFLALPILAAGALALAWPSSGSVPGFVAAFCLALAAALVVPGAADLLLAALLARPAGGRWTLLRMAAANIRANASRTGVAMAALTVALAMAIAMGTMVGSFRRELERWIEGIVRGDLYVSPLGIEADREGATLPADLPRRLRGLPGVAEVATYRELPATVRGRDTFLSAIDVAVVRQRADWPLLSGGSPEAFFDALDAGHAGISESLQRKTGIRPGEAIEVRLGERVERLSVAGVYRDYTTESGVVLVDHRAFARRGDLGPPRSAALYLEPGADPGAVAAAVRGAAGADLGLVVRTNDELRARALAIFDRTFAITRVLQGVALAVAAIGILGALLAMLLERTRDLATLRALGLTRAQLGGLFLGESTLLAALAWLFALATGAGLAWILLNVINVRSFGWALEYRVPLSTWAGALAASLAASWAATLWPLARLGRMDVATLLREE